MAPERLFDEVERVDDGAQADEPSRLELREMREPNADWVVRIRVRDRIAHQGCRAVFGEHDRFALEGVKANGIGDLMDRLDHGLLAPTNAEESKHVDGSIDRPFDIVVEDGFQLVGLAIFERSMKRARKMPETVLCHCADPDAKSTAANGPKGVIVIDDAVPEC